MSAPVIPRVSSSPAECFTVRNGWAWANIYVRHGAVTDPGAAGRPRGWVEVAVNSDYGSFSYFWSHIGCTPWQKFLAGLDFHYAMQKFMGPHFRVPLMGSEAQEEALKAILDRRRTQRALTKGEARVLWDAAKDATTDSCEAFLRDWDNRSDGLFYSHEFWDGRWDKVNPQAEGFWADVWPHFVAHIDPGPGSQRDADGGGS